MCEPALITRLVALATEELRFASMALGVLSVMTSGPALMPVWCADNWDTLPMVTSMTNRYMLQLALINWVTQTECYVYIACWWLDWLPYIMVSTYIMEIPSLAA